DRAALCACAATHTPLLSPLVLLARKDAGLDAQRPVPAPRYVAGSACCWRPEVRLSAGAAAVREMASDARSIRRASRFYRRAPADSIRRTPHGVLADCGSAAPEKGSYPFFDRHCLEKGVRPL